MTTDNQTIEDFGVETSETSIDIRCQSSSQESLRKITQSWHNLQSAKSFFEYCALQLPDNERQVISEASGYEYDSDKSVEFDDMVPTHISSAIENLDTAKVDEMKKEIQIAFVSLAEKENLDEKIVQEVITKQKAEITSAENTLSRLDSEISQEEKRYEEIQKSIAFEGMLLFFAFILGLGGGFWGIAIAMIVVLVWRSNS